MKRRKSSKVKILSAIAIGLLASAIYGFYEVSNHSLETVRPIAEKYSNQFDVEPALVMAVIRAESSGDPSAVSHAGAIGLMQVMPDTAEMIARLLKEPVPTKTALMDPDLNIRFGTFYLSWLQEQFGTQPQVLMASYNAGPSRVYRWLSANQGADSVEIVENCPIEETRVYIRRATRYLCKERERYSRFGKNK